MTTDGETKKGGVGRRLANGGITIGMVLAICISWSVNKSVAWAVVHGLLSWIYVVYYLIT